MARLIIVSNRLPITVDKKKDGDLFYHPSAGGLATGLNSLDNDLNKIWIGWPGEIIEDGWEQKAISQELTKDNLIPVFLTQEEKEFFYEGFSNKTIWPHFHYFTQYTSYRDRYWQAYKKVNEKFAELVCKHIQKDDLVWVHDYQLLLLPQMIRKAFPNVSIGFFLHIPFPSYEIFRILPWRRELLNGFLGADQIGFHTYGYMRHFLSAVYRITGYDHKFGKINVGNRIVNVDVFPMGIDYQKYATPPNFVEEKNGIEAQFLDKNQKMVLSIDRLDYTKGIPERIKAFRQFFEKHPHYIGKVTLVMVVVPSRSNVDQYADLKKELDTLVGNINAKYRTFNWTPIRYFYRSFPFNELTSMYRAAEIALITPLRDGMNLVAKEFIAAKEQSKKGVLILSEMAGASNELTDALIVNPNDSVDIVNALLQALEMSLEEQEERLVKMQENLKKFDVRNWAETFMNEQIGLIEFKHKQKTNLINETIEAKLLDDYNKAKQRLIILDYDGTLMNFNKDPQAVVPDQELLDNLNILHSNDKNKLIIITGRDKDTMVKWFSEIDIEMATEHGVWIKRKGKWRTFTNIYDTWKKDVRPVLENLVHRTPGSFIEEKDYSLAWHYRKIDKDLGEKRIREFKDVLHYLTANLDLQVLEGNKVVEIKNADVNKGKAAQYWLNDKKWDFILAIGDDRTDEDIFKVLPSNAYSIKVGLNQTKARFNIMSVEDVRTLLNKITSKT